MASVEKVDNEKIEFLWHHASVMKFDEISIKSKCASCQCSQRSSAEMRVAPDTGISNKAMAILNSFVNDIFECICKPKQISAEAGTS